MKEHELDPAARARMRLLADLTEPSEAELDRVLAHRVTRDDAATDSTEAAATTPSWVEEQRVRAKALSAAPPSRDPRAVGWARATAPTSGELDRVVPAAPDLSLAAASAPTDDEVSRLVHGSVPAAWVDWTQPTDIEVQRLIARSPELLDRRRPRWRPGLALGGAALGLAAAAAVAIGVTLVLPTDTYGTPELALGEASSLSPSKVIDLGPSIDLTVHALPERTAPPRVRLARADAEQTVVDVLDGGTRFEVDPSGLHRHLTVRAGDVEVVVKGTVFTVDALDGERVAVGVERGRVQVTDPSGTRFLTAGQAWRSDVGRIATAAAEPVPDSLIARSIPQAEPEVSSDTSEAAPTERVAASPRRDPAPTATRPLPSPPTDGVIARDADTPEVAGPAKPPRDDTAEELPAEELPAEELPTDWPPRVMPGSDAGASADAAPAAAVREARIDAQAQATLDAYNRLHEIRARFKRGEDPSVVRGMLSRFVSEPEMPANLALAGQDLQVDVTRATGDAKAFEQEVLLLERLDPDRPTLPDLKLERARRLLEAGYLARATRAWEEARSLPGDHGVRAIVGLADCARQAGSPTLEAEHLRDALRLANDPALSSTIRERLDALSTDRRRR